jgi:hypothetical protein
VSEVGGQQIAYGDAMDAFPAWVDLESQTGFRVSGWRINRGRVDETQRTGTGTATINVNDTTGALGSGAEFPTHARLLLRGSPRFRGFVDEINVEVNHNRPDLSHVSIECVDLFDHLSTVELLAGVHGNLIDIPAGMEQYVFYTDDEIQDMMFRVLDDAQVPSALRSVFTGNVVAVGGGFQSPTTAMQILDELADAEWPGVSNRFVDSTGRYCFRGRFARFNPTDPTYGIQFWEAGTGSQVTSGRAQIRRLSYSTSRKLIVNSAIAYPEGAREDEFPEYIIEDATSQATYGRRSWSAENLRTKRHLSDGTNGADQAVLFATYQVQNYKQPVPRINRVQFRSLRDEDDRAAATWDLMCNVEIGDVLDIYADAISGRYFVEGITLDVRELDGTIPWAICDLDLSPAAFWTTDPF